MTSVPKIVLAGDVCIDHNEVNGRKYVNWGSLLMYVAHYLSSHTNFRLELIASHGDDFKAYEDTVKISNEPSQVETLIYNNIVTGDHRTQYCHNITSSAPVNINKSIKQSLLNADIFVFAPLTPNYKPEYILELLNYMQVASLKVLSPQGYMRHIGKDGLVSKSQFINEANIVPLFDIIVASDEDCDDALDVAKRWVSYKESLNVVITENKNGATLVNKDGQKHIATIPVPPSEIVDSVGSGDVFTAKLIANFYDTKDMIKAIEVGNDAAREKLLANVSSTITEPRDKSSQDKSSNQVNN